MMGLFSHHLLIGIPLHWFSGLIRIHLLSHVPYVNQFLATTYPLVWYPTMLLLRFLHPTKTQLPVQTLVAHLPTQLTAHLQTLQTEPHRFIPWLHVLSLVFLSPNTSLTFLRLLNTRCMLPFFFLNFNQKDRSQLLKIHVGWLPCMKKWRLYAIITLGC